MRAQRSVWRLSIASGISAGFLIVSSGASADEGGVSFWLPGQFGSLASVPGTPGWALPVIYYHMAGDEGGSKNFPIGGAITAGIDAGADLAFFVPTYTFADPVAGGQLSLSLAWAYGQTDVSAQATLTEPRGNVISAQPSDSTTGSSDLYPNVSLKWHDGTNNYLAYAMAGVPVGSYEVGRLANIGTNHWSIDAGGGYTYFNQKNGRELSAVAGLTYNFENSDTDYQNGVDGHIDLAASQFFSPTLHVGLVGYIYYQLGGDSGSGARLGDFKSRVYSIGPQVGMFLGERKLYLNLKGYYEFDAKNRPEGWNAWLTLLIPFGTHG